MNEPPQPATKSKTNFSLLQIFRGWAAILVILTHATGISSSKHGASFLGDFFEMGNAGVDFFFVLSGFLICFIHRKDFGHPDRLRSYLKKRAVRIFPIYWLVTLIILPVYFLVPSYGQGDETHLSVIVGSFLLFPIDRGPILVAGWSLRHEVLFYGLFALLIGFRGKWVWALVGAWVVGVVFSLVCSLSQDFRGAFPDLSPWQHVLWWPQNVEFLVGAVAAVYITSPRAVRTSQRVCFWGLVVALLSFLFCGAVIPGIVSLQSGVHILVYGGLSFCIVVFSTLIDLRGGLSPRVVKSPIYRLMQYFGDASYSVYLVHGPALSVLFKVAGSLGCFQKFSTQLITPIIIVLTLSVGCLFHSLVELPLLKTCRRRTA
jgi:exopolysaccharide production protein ExoZ